MLPYTAHPMKSKRGRRAFVVVVLCCHCAVAVGLMVGGTTGPVLNRVEPLPQLIESPLQASSSKTKTDPETATDTHLVSLLHPINSSPRSAIPPQGHSTINIPHHARTSSRIIRSLACTTSALQSIVHRHFLGRRRGSSNAT